MATAIPPTSYMGFHLDPVLLPNAPYHFKINGFWPYIPDLCNTFDINQFVSPPAKLWAPTVMSIQNPAFVAQLLTTFANQEAAVHLDKTPILAASVTKAPPDSALKSAQQPAATIQP